MTLPSTNALAGAFFRCADDILEGTSPGIFDEGFFIFIVLEDLRIDGRTFVASRAFRLIDPGRPIL